jgi:hypothetical protein
MICHSGQGRATKRAGRFCRRAMRVRARNLGFFVTDTTLQGYTVHFEVKQQPYFLDFIPENGRWFLFKPTRSGIEAVPVVNDDEATLFPDEIEVDADPEVVN